jgi:hypothetical protein
MIIHLQEKGRFIERFGSPDQPRDDHGKWTSGGGSSETKSTEQSLDEMMAKAPAAKEEIDTLAKSLATKFGGVAACPKIKSKERALEKIKNDYGGDASRIKDLARNTIIVPQEKIPEVLEALKAGAAEIKIKTAENDPLGYSGANVFYQTKAGIKAEIQVNSPQMIFAKGPEGDAKGVLGEHMFSEVQARSGVECCLGHKFYEDWRKLPQDDPHRDTLAAACKNYYKSVRERT